jgi:hypothetical protein
LIAKAPHQKSLNFLRPGFAVSGAMTCSGRGIGIGISDTAGVTEGTGATDVAGAGMATDHARIAAYAQVITPKPSTPCGRERLPRPV